MAKEKDSQSRFSSIQFVRAQVRLVQNLSDDEPIAAERAAQELAGLIMQAGRRAALRGAKHEFESFSSAMLTPHGCKAKGAVMYIHGGGYCCGSLAYAKGFGSVIAAETGIRVFCPAYRLAPEHPYPSAIDDCITAYRRLLKSYAPESISLIGESAGGGLVFSLCLKAKELGLPLPGGLVAISPWTDLTASGESYITNDGVDPSLNPRRLHRMAELYATDFTDPIVSPLFGDLTGLPESMIFAGGDEVMLSDAKLMHDALIKSGCKSSLTVSSEMWHAYILYGLKERRHDLEDICAFLRRISL